jgi:hypothetical protein
VSVVRAAVAKLDGELSDAENAIGEFSNAETRETDPEAHAFGAELYDRLEAMRWEIRRFAEKRARRGK